MTQLATTIHGSIVAIVTPMLEDGNVDWAGLKQLVEWHIEQGTHSIVAVGTTGEASTLSMDEHIKVIAEIVRITINRPKKGYISITKLLLKPLIYLRFCTMFQAVQVSTWTMKL